MRVLKDFYHIESANVVQGEVIVNIDEARSVDGEGNLLFKDIARAFGLSYWI